MKYANLRVLNQNKLLLIIFFSIFISLLNVACSSESKKNYKVGIINIVSVLNDTVKGFKQGMAELGYVEGENITYIYDDAALDFKKFSDIANSLVAAKVDLILSIGTPATIAAKQATAKTELPVVFVPVTDPIKSGIVESIQQPGGNITGVTFGFQEMRRFEWLVRIASGVKKIYVPYNPEDHSPVLSLTVVRKTAEKLGVELITKEFRNPEQLASGFGDIPADADAVFLVPDSLLSTRISDLIESAIKLNLPVSAANVEAVKAKQALMSYGIDLNSSGKQAARLAGQIFHGVKPADLPIETAEFYLSINLRVAKTIGLDIPDEILRQADNIIR
jgi:putative ABC transport system substrate-binding protein